MHAPINQEALQEKWAPLLDAEGQDPIKDAHRRMVTAVLLENQEQALTCLLYTSPSPRDATLSRMPASA